MYVYYFNRIINNIVCKCYFIRLILPFKSPILSESWWVPLHVVEQVSFVNQELPVVKSKKEKGEKEANLSFLLMLKFSIFYIFYFLRRYR